MPISFHRLSKIALAGCAMLVTIAGFLQSQTPQNIKSVPWGKTRDGQQVFLYTLRNASGMEVKITNYGGTITSISVPDRNKKFDDVVLGFDSLDGYTSANNKSYFGALIGRYGNRIGRGRFKLNGRQYQVTLNEPADKPVNMLHGGLRGFDKQVWEASVVTEGLNKALELRYLSHDREEGFPGNLNVTVRYSLDSKNGLRIDYSATSDKDTVINLTNHAYFNLAGAGNESILNHRLTLAADRFTPIDAGLIPTGALENVAGTPFDFRTATAIGARINDNNQQLKYGKGYDQNFVLNHPGQLGTLAAKVEEPNSGRVLEVYTTQPGIQFYSGNFLDGTVHGIGGVYRQRSALCLETQHFPDSPNHPNFPSTVLRPGQQFRSTTIYRFTTE